MLGGALTLGLHLLLLGVLTHGAPVGGRTRPQQPSPGPLLIVRLLPDQVTQAMPDALPFVRLAPPAVAPHELARESPPAPAAAPPVWMDPLATTEPDPSADSTSPDQPISPAPVVDRPALPLTEPDLDELLPRFTASGHPIHLRLHISATGQVSHVQVIECLPEDQELAQALADVLRETPHIPARHDGQDVASIKDIWVELAPKLTRQLLF